VGSPEVGGGDCDDVRRHLWSYLNQGTDPPTSAELEAHLEGCRYCRRMVQFDQSFKRLVRRCADAEPLSPSMVETLRMRVEEVQAQRVADARSVSPSVVGASKIDRLGSALHVFLTLTCTPLGWCG
jgi:anti-sigma factor (TIGR02949 family)